MLKKLFDLFIFSSIYVALCAVVMVWQTSRLLLGTPPPGRLTGFVFFSTICSYNFHWYLTGRSANATRRLLWTQRHRISLFLLCLAGGIGSAIYFFSLMNHLPALCFAAIVTFLYSAPKIPHPLFRSLRHIAVGKTIFLSLVWTYVTAVLPVLIAAAPLTGGVVVFALSRFFLIYAICILFDYRDREDDRQDGIRSLVTILHEKAIDRLFIASLVLFAAATISLSHWHFPAFYILLLLIPGALLAALHRTAKKDFSDYLYYFVLDGLTMFSGLLMLIFRI